MRYEYLPLFSIWEDKLREVKESALRAGKYLCDPVTELQTTRTFMVWDITTSLGVYMGMSVGLQHSFAIIS